MVRHLDMAELEAGLAHIQASSADEGIVQMIVARPTDDERVTLDTGVFSLENGLEGDNWRARGSKRTDDGRAHPEMQITLMNSRYLALVAGEQSRWPLAGDQLIVDMDLQVENLPPGQRLQMGTAVFEVTAVPHAGCKKFAARFGTEAVKFANSEVGKVLRLRGIYVKVIQPGTVQVGDMIQKVNAEV